jgi:Zn-dependent protease
MNNFSTIQIICIWVIPVLTAITFHEAAHAYVAYRCGDDTAKRLGRLSINPINHIDPIGTILIPIIIAYMSHFQFIFGWAKPVPINWSRFKHPKRDTMKVALAGPLMNFILALGFGFGFSIFSKNISSNNLIQLFFIETCRAGFYINLILGWFNLLPIPPLDGSKVLSACLPRRLDQIYQELEPYGFFILIILIMTGFIQVWLRLILNFVNGVLGLG